MSSITVISDSAELLTRCRYSAWRGWRSVPSASSVMPRMPFMGVRISWLMLARNSLLALLAASAEALASRSSAWVRSRIIPSARLSATTSRVRREAVESGFGEIRPSAPRTSPLSSSGWA